ncbi:MAG: SpoVA/SpoVAEb family sporulation membrane protein [bacterium]|nr:SpoVA/SpoVAEb family sporulation membrane protein [bacterium]
MSKNNQTNNKGPDIGEVINEKDSKLRDQKYNEYVKNITPTHNCFLNCLKAFLVGGIICTIGQAFLNLYMNFGLEQETAAACNSITLIGISIILTGLNIYPSITKYGGAGAVVPITGFANGVVAPAMEYKTEGQVFGIGCKLFIIAGPVILYGIFSSWVLGWIYYILKLLKVV